MILLLFCLITFTFHSLAYEPLQIKTYNTQIPTHTECMLGAHLGGTHTDFGIFKIQDNKPTLLFSLHTKTKSITVFTDVVRDIMHYAQSTYNISINHACFAAPGVATANKDYASVRGFFDINSKDLIEQCGLTTALIVNDVFVIGYGITCIDPQNIIQIHGNTPQDKGPCAILSAATGLGSSYLVWNTHTQQYTAYAGEASSAEFAPINQYEFDLANHIKHMLDAPVTYWSWLISGKGIKHIYSMLKLTGDYHDSLHLDTHDPKIIFANPQDDLCNATLALYFKLYARFARNYVLTFLPYGGLYLAGSIAEKNIEYFSTLFAQEYVNCAPVVQKKFDKIPVYVITDCNVRLYGAAQYLIGDLK